MQPRRESNENQSAALALVVGIVALVVFVIATTLVFNALEDDGPDVDDYEFTYSMDSGTVVCPDDYRRAGQEFSYVTDDELTRTERLFNDKYDEQRLAEKKVIAKNCGGRSESAVCPDDRERAGRRYTYDPDDIGYGTFDKTREQLVEERCGLTKEQADLARRQAEADREAGFHCLSAYDGNFDNLERLIRAQLHDPSSMETVSTRIAPAMDNGKHPVELVFRATNQYGAVVTVTALGSAHADSCIAELFSIGDQIFANAGYSHEIFGIIPSE